jgi:hypothetical protein
MSRSFASSNCFDQLDLGADGSFVEADCLSPPFADALDVPALAGDGVHIFLLLIPRNIGSLPYPRVAIIAFLTRASASPGPDDRRGRDEFVAVAWERVLDLLADELSRVRDAHGPGAIFGGSYGWSGAGRFHHAQSRPHRFLNRSLGGYVRPVNSYSAGVSGVLLPHILGPMEAVSRRNVTTGAWYDPVDPAEEKPLCVHGNPNAVTRDVGTSRLAQACGGQLTTVEVERFGGNLPPIQAYDPPPGAVAAEPHPAFAATSPTTRTRTRKLLPGR